MVVFLFFEGALTFEGCFGIDFETDFRESKGDLLGVLIALTLDEGGFRLVDTIDLRTLAADFEFTETLSIELFLPPSFNRDSLLPKIDRDGLMPVGSFFFVERFGVALLEGGFLAVDLTFV